MISILEFIKRDLPEQLIDENGYHRMAEVARALPERFSSFWGFECRLAEPEALSDILFEVTRDSRGHAFLAGDQPSSIDDLCGSSAVWQNIRSFARQWGKPDHPFHSDIRNLWLEFDTAGASSSALSRTILCNPSVFFGPEGENGHEERLYRVIPDAVAALGRERSSISMQMLDSFIASLPEGARLFQVGLMLSRGEDGLRLCVEKIPPCKLPSWLTSLGWKGDGTALTSLLEALIPIVRKISIGINLTRQGPCPKIGLECYMEWLNDDFSQWEPVLKYAQGLGLSLPQKMKGVVEYPGISRSSILDRLNPDGTLRLHLFRKIHHLKFTFDGRHTTEIKAYFAVTQPEIDLKNWIGKDENGSSHTFISSNNKW